MQEFGPDVELDDPAFIHPTALIYGKVLIGKGCSVWPYAVMRAESTKIRIGEYSNIQDFAMIHVGTDEPTRIGANCSITHRATVHGATIGDNCLIGIGATIMDGAVIGENSIVAGGTFVPEGKVILKNSIVMGVPARVVRTNDNTVFNRANAWLYHQNALGYARGDHRVWASEAFQKEFLAMRQSLEAELAVAGAATGTV